MRSQIAEENLKRIGKKYQQKIWTTQPFVQDTIATPQKQPKSTHDSTYAKYKSHEQEHLNRSGQFKNNSRCLSLPLHLRYPSLWTTLKKFSILFTNYIKPNLMTGVGDWMMIRPLWTTPKKLYIPNVNLTRKKSMRIEVGILMIITLSLA